jgi:hypothetical protein
MKLNLFGIPIDILIEIIDLVKEIVKLFTPNQQSKFQQPKSN